MPFYGPSSDCQLRQRLHSPKIRRPNVYRSPQGDAGEVMRGYYRVTGDVLTMCSEDGKSTGKTHKLQPGDDPRVVATRLLRAEMLKQSRSDFNRRINYSPLGVA